MVLIIGATTGTWAVEIDDSGGGCGTIGTWDPETKTCTLTADVNETIRISGSNITLDGNGHTVTGSGTGVEIPNGSIQGCTIKNLNITGFDYGIYVQGGYPSSVGNHILENNTVSGNNHGINIIYATDNILSGNIVENSTWTGISLSYSSGNTVTGNIANYNQSGGFSFSNANGNQCSGNIANANVKIGFRISGGESNELIGNTATSNTQRGINVSGIGHTVSGNTVQENGTEGIYLDGGATGIKVVDNTVTYNTGSGIVLWDAGENNVIDRNMATNNGYHGIYLVNSSFSTIFGNTLSSNAWYGVRLMVSSTGNHIGYNSISSNGQFGIEFSASNDNAVYLNTISNNGPGSVTSDSVNTWGSPNPFYYDFNNGSLYQGHLGNYYSDHGYALTDSNGDGIMDAAYDLLGSEPEDAYPLAAALDQYRLLAWWLHNDGRMYGQDAIQDPGSIILDGGANHIWIEDPALPQTRNGSESLTWLGQAAFTAAPAAGDTFQVEVGYSTDGTDFISGGPDATFAGDGTRTILGYETDADAFSVPEGQHLALRITNTSGSQYILRTGECWSYVSSVVETGTGPPSTYTLTVTQSGSGTGTVTSSPAGIDSGNGDTTEVFGFGTPVTLTADADPGSIFKGWGGDCSGSEPTCSLILNADTNVSVIFTDTIPPTLPTGLQPSTLPETLTTDTTIEVSWTAGDDPGGSGVAGYNIEWNTAPDTVLPKIVKTTSTFSVSPVLPTGNNHWFHVCTVDNEGNTSDTVHLGPFYVEATGEVTYVFERMWPILQQPWYFNNPAFVTVDQNGYVYISNLSNNNILKYTSDGRLVSRIGAPGYFGDDQFYYPCGLVTDSSGHLYVVDRANDRVQKLTTNGEFVSKWGGHGTGDGQFDTPCAIAMDNSGYLYVSDQFNHRVQKFTSDGQFVTRWGSLGTGDGQFDYPYGMAVDSAGYIYVVDKNNNRVQKFTSDGQFVLKWAYSSSEDGHMNSPYGIAVDSSDYVYVTDYQNIIQKFTTSGEFVAQWGSQNSGSAGDGFHLPKGIAVDRDGFLYIVDGGNNRIQKSTTDGQFITRWESKGYGDGQFNLPNGITMDSNGYIYVADEFNDRIQKFTSEGMFVKKWGTEGDAEGQFKDPRGVAVDSNGDIYVCEWGNHRIQKFTSDGVLLSIWGNRGTDNGQLDGPHDIAIYNDGSNEYIYVVDAHNRVQKFTTDGQFVLIWGGTGSGEGQFDGAGDIAVNSEGYVYVTDTGNSRIQKFDSNGGFETQWGSYDYGMQGQGYFSASIDSIAVDLQGCVYVTDSNIHANIYRLQKFDSNGNFMTQWGASGSDPGLFNQVAGLWVSTAGMVYASEFKNNRVQVFKPQTVISTAKAIIVAGGGPFPGNNLWDATQLCANFAYRALTYQGFSKETIYYLTSDIDLDLDDNGELDDVDGDPTNQNLQEAVTSWASDADNLVVYLVDHGGDGTFRMSGTEILDASDLDAWLDQLQLSIPGHVIVVYDACQSGSFLSTLGSDGGGERVVITSTSPGESAYFVSQGTISFSNYFWTHVFNGVNIKDAFELSRSALSNTTSYQHPFLDANENGVENEIEDMNIAQAMHIGNGTLIHGDTPVIGSVSDPQTIINSSTAPLVAYNVTDDNGIARVWAVIRPPDYQQGSTYNPVQELPTIELRPIGSDQYEGTYDGFNLTGTYQIAIYARDGIGNTSIPKLTTVTVNNPLTRKAIVVAGGTQSDPLLPVVLQTSKLVCEALAFQGYTSEDVYLMSPSSIQGITLPTVLPTLSNLEYAITAWAAENTQDLVLYMVGNGRDGSFEINGSEMLSATNLDTWLDDLQGSMAGKVTVIYDACQSGSFIPLLTPLADRERILISSTSVIEPAYFISGGDISFSAFFWRQVLKGMNVRDSFLYAKKAMSYCSGQTPQLDDNGNGTGNEKLDGLLARNYSIGVGIMLAGDDPLVGVVSPDVTLNGTSTAEIWAENITTTNAIDKVWAVVFPPGDARLSDVVPQVVELLDNDGDNRYEGIIGDAVQFGTYTVAIYAMDISGNVSLPIETHILQNAGPDLYEDDDTYLSAGIITINDIKAQRHSFHDAEDEDWVKFYGIAGETYEIKTENAGESCDTVIWLLDHDGVTLIEERDDYIAGENELISWLCPVDGLYYVKITEYNETFGANTGYDLRVYHPVGGASGMVLGQVIDYMGNPISGAIINSDIGGFTAITLPNGYFLIDLPVGTHTIHAEAEGYGKLTQSAVEVGAENHFTLMFAFSSTSIADINGDGKADLADVILALKLLSGMDPAEGIRPDFAGSSADIGQNGTIGIEEAVYIMQRVSQLQIGCGDSEDCSETNYCMKPMGECQAQGTCQKRPQACTDEYDPVCGCDGVTYSNSCYAGAAGASIAYMGPCY